MKQILTALTVAASLIASGVSAFEMNLTLTEENRIVGKPMVGDLTVGVRALIYASDGCTIDGKFYLGSFVEIATEQRDYISYYKINLAADGLFYMTYGPNLDGAKHLPHNYREIHYNCSAYTDPDATFIPVQSINGFTDKRSFYMDLINKGYE